MIVKIKNTHTMGCVACGDGDLAITLSEFADRPGLPDCSWKKVNFKEHIKQVYLKKYVYLKRGMERLGDKEKSSGNSMIANWRRKFTESQK